MKMRAHIPAVVRRMALLCVAVSVATAPSTARAAGVVGTGSAASCTDAALNTALDGGGVVTFDCGGPATIDISTGTGTKTIFADTTIDGGGTVTISGGNRVGVFRVDAGVNFAVENLTIANGNQPTSPIDAGGGGIQVAQEVGRGTPSGRANSSGMLTVTNSVFSGNNASGGDGVGGGILNGGGTLTLANSTFSGNSANGGGGGIFNGGGTLTVTNSTFSGNSAFLGAGGISSAGGTLTVTNSTFSGNSALVFGGGGISNNGMATVENTIVATSTSGGNCSGPITDGGHNIDDGTTCGFTGTGCATTGGSSFCSTNPQLDPAGLANNGGPTQTIALQADSPAVNAGDESVCAGPPVNGLDQRGYVRPGMDATSCSIGAYEYNSSGATPTPTPTPTRPPALCVGDCGGTHTVAIHNLITLVSIALGTAQSSACTSGIPDGAQVNIALLIQAVNNALFGCGNSP